MLKHFKSHCSMITFTMQVRKNELSSYIWGLNVKLNIQSHFVHIDFYVPQAQSAVTSAPVTLPLVLKSSEITESSYFNWYRKSIKDAYELLRPPAAARGAPFLDSPSSFLISRQKKVVLFEHCLQWHQPGSLKLKGIWVWLSSETFFILNRDFLWKGIWLNVLQTLRLRIRNSFLFF